jgi:hypothetical protein
VAIKPSSGKSGHHLRPAIPEQFSFTFSIDRRTGGAGFARLKETGKDSLQILLASEPTALLNPMAGNLNQILLGLFPYAVPAFFSLLVAIAWVIAFAKLKHIGALVLAFASLVGSILSVASGLLWIFYVKGERQLIQYMGPVGFMHAIVVACLMIVGAFLLAFHRPGKPT